jgi:NTE family protein
MAGARAPGNLRLRNASNAFGRAFLVATTGRKTAFVFTGGGSLGAIQVGMVRVLLASGVFPDFVVGASVGAINAAYFACAPDLSGVAALERIWVGIRRADIFPFSLASLFGLIKHPGNIVDPGGLRRVIEANLSCARIEETKIPLHIMATNHQGQAAPRSRRSWRVPQYRACSHPWKLTATS